jgi:putative membrane protein
MNDEKRDIGSPVPAGRAAGSFEVIEVIDIDDDAPESVQKKSDERTDPLLIVMDTDDETPITPTREDDVDVPPPSPDLSRYSIGAGTYAVASLVALLLVYWTFSLVHWVKRNGVLGYGIILPFVVTAALFSVWWLCSEILAWWRLAKADRLRADLSDTGQSPTDTDRFLSALRHLEATMEGPQRRAVAEFLSKVDRNRGADELRVILDHDVIHPMDDDALAAVHRAVYDSFFLALISHTPITDTAAFVIRAIGMIWAVAVAYGHRPGKVGLYRLVRRMLADVAILSSVTILMGRASSGVHNVIEKTAHLATGALSGAHPVAGMTVGAAGGLLADVTEAVAEPISDAATAAARTAQLGLLAIAVSRPITLSADRKADLSSRLRRMIFSLHRAGQQRLVHHQVGEDQVERLAWQSLQCVCCPRETEAVVARATQHPEKTLDPLRIIVNDENSALGVVASCRRVDVLRPQSARPPRCLFSDLSIKVFCCTPERVHLLGVGLYESLVSACV